MQQTIAIRLQYNAKSGFEDHKTGKIGFGLGLRFCLHQQLHYYTLNDPQIRIFPLTKQDQWGQNQNEDQKRHGTQIFWCYINHSLTSILICRFIL